jgi:hypothetical protein
MDSSDLVLDGNAAAGALEELFGREVTTAAGVCAGCGAEHAVGELVVYAHAPGIVIRCRSCESVMIRLVRTRERLFVDLRGCRSVTLRA